MSSRSLRMFISQEDLAAVELPTGMNATTVDPVGDASDQPQFILHGAKGDEPFVNDLKSALIEPDALVIAADPPQGDDGTTPATESQQLDEAAEEAAEDKAAELAALADEAAAVVGRQKVFILHGNVSGETDSSNDMHKTFSALAKSALEDPYNTVAAFLPVDGNQGNAELSRDTEELQHMLREEGVPYVTSVEALAEHLNFILEGHKTLTMSTEGAKTLRPGMRVRYSHGHGKIQKILTSPTKIAGKLHHASKDKPLYVVRNDKGGHIGVHKASALTPV